MKKSENRIKQISIVLESNEEFDELDLIGNFKIFLEDYDDNVKIVGTHTKILKPIGKRGNGQDTKSYSRY
jgi:hypothetical protein